MGFEVYKYVKYVRNTHTSTISKGRGVLIALLSSLISKPILLCNNEIELIYFVIIQLP